MEKICSVPSCKTVFEGETKLCPKHLEEKRRNGKRYRENNPEKRRQENHRHWLKYRLKTNGKRYGYSITSDEFESLLEKQHGVCAICGEPPKPLRQGYRASLHIDHNHDTGRVRGLLCFNCNAALGNAKENPEILFKMILYLKKWSNDSSVSSAEKSSPDTSTSKNVPTVVVL